jgi:hypothetical protein
MTQNAQIPTTIAQQIGNRAFYMLGAKNLAGSENSLLFAVGRNSKGVNRIKVTLNAMDTYDVTGYSVRGITITEKARLTNIYNDQLHGALETITGMYTSL